MSTLADITNNSKYTEIGNEIIQENFFSNLSLYSTIELIGEQSKKFLHDFSTINTDELQNKVCFGAICNNKGQVIANIYAYYLNEVLFLKLPKITLDITLQHVKKYQPLYKITITDVSDMWSSLAIITNNTKKYTEIIRNLNSSKECSIVIQKANLSEMLEFTTSNARLFQKMWEYLKGSELKQASVNSIQNYLINKKYVDITPSISEMFTPNHLAYENFDGISYNKGCYLGQEIIARIKYKTALKTTLNNARITSSAPILPGQKTTLEGKSVTVLSSVEIAENTWNILGIGK